MSDMQAGSDQEEVLVTEEAQAAETPVVPPGVGERLRAAREALALDVETIAATLKLSRRQVEALEAGDWARLPGTTFIRGFVRNYARVLQIDPVPLLADLDAPSQEVPRLDLPQNATAVMPDSGKVQRRDYATVLAGMVLIAVAVVAYFVVPADIWQSKPREVPQVEAPATAPIFPPDNTVLNAPAGNVPPVADAAAPATDTGAGNVVVAAVPAVASSDTTIPTVASAPAVVTGKNLKFSFSQPSWVEVRDGTGQLVFSQLNDAGTEREVEGRPPFFLVVGNAAHVKVQYKGRNIELQPRSKDDVARVTVE